MKLDKFIEKLDKGEITDFKPYIEKEKLDILLEIAKRGLEVDYLLKRGEFEVIRNLIQNGHASEYYYLWKHHSNKVIREDMAKQGLFRDEFINDGNYEVRLAAAGNDPEYLIKLANKTKADTEKRKITARFCRISNLTLEQIDFILKSEYTTHLEKAYRLKRDGMLKEPTVFEKTLTVTQLFMLNNPLWTLGLPAKIIYDILDYYEYAKKNNWADHFDGFLDRIVANSYENIYTIYIDYSKQFGTQTKEY